MWVTLTPSIARYVRITAKKEKIPRATIVVRMIEEQLEKWKVRDKNLA